MTRVIAKSFNHQYGETFVIPEERIDENLMTIPGTDGQKMSKSYGNIIDIFLPEKQLKKAVGGIVTDSTPLEDPKDPDTDNVFAIYKLLADESQTEELRKKYIAGNFGYGHAKKELLELILDKYSEERKAFDGLMADLGELENQLAKGEEKARLIANEVLDRTRKKLGY